MFYEVKSIDIFMKGLKIVQNEHDLPHGFGYYDLEMDGVLELKIQWLYFLN